jgi:hypothetical protein
MIAKSILQDFESLEPAAIFHHLRDMKTQYLLDRLMSQGVESGR